MKRVVPILLVLIMMITHVSAMAAADGNDEWHTAEETEIIGNEQYKAPVPYETETLTLEPLQEESCEGETNITSGDEMETSSGVSDILEKSEEASPETSVEQNDSVSDGESGLIQENTFEETNAGDAESNENNLRDAEMPNDAKAGEAVDVSEHFHAIITTKKDTYTSGETALVAIRYTVDQKTVSPGDYVIVTIPEDIASGASFSYSSQHFSGMEYLGNGQYKLIFGADAASSLAGSMSIRVNTSAETTTTDIITVGDGEKEITVVGSGSGQSGDTSFPDEAIMKDGLGNTGMSYGGYDYSDDPPAQIGIFDSSVDNDFTYRLYINRKNVTMTNVTVTDTLPDGMYFVGASTVVCYKMDPTTMTTTDEILSGAVISISGQNLSVYLGDIDYPVEIQYQVHVPVQTSVYLRNHSEITYTQDGTTYQEHQDYIAQGDDYSAVNGIKRVDKTIISDDPSDQWVTYTIEFWNENGFATGEISLIDDLDDYVTFLYAENNEYFELTVDENDPSILHIANIKEIPGGTHVYETFVCDFSGVPIGHTVFNTAGGNTTITAKIRAIFALTATKAVDGLAPREGEIFTFKLMDQNRRVLQTVPSDENGKVSFQELHYGVEDLGKTFTYYVAEEIPSEDNSFLYDTSEYVVVVTVGEAADEDGNIPVTVSISKNGTAIDGVSFNNERPAIEKTRVSGSKIWNDADNQDGKRPESIIVNLYADGVKIDSKTVTAEDGWEWEFNDLIKYNGDRLIVYTVDEGPVPEYQSEVDGYDITNSYSPKKISIPVNKVWVGPAAESVTIELLADGEKAAEAVLNEANGWQHIFTDLDQYRNGKEIVYTLREGSVDGYASEISGDLMNGFIITNTSTETMEIPVEKQWVGPAAESVTINLLADGVKAAGIVLNADNDWKHTFTGLPKYDSADGHAIEYTIRENPVAGYTASISGDARSGFFITNKKTSLPTPSEIPKTGDETHLSLYLWTTAISGFGLIGILLTEKKKNRRNRP